MMSKENNHNKRPLEKATEQQGQKKRKGLKDITNTSESSANVFIPFILILKTFTNNFFTPKATTEK